MEENGSYCLIIHKKNGEVSKHYFDTYEDMEYNSVFVQFSPNCVKAFGKVFNPFTGWKTVFKIG